MNELILVEDNPTLGHALQATLEVEGFSVHVAPDAASGIALAHRLRSTLVIVDVTLGGQQGYQVARAPRRRRGCVVSRAELLRTVWGWYPDTETHTVDIHISRLRRLIEPDPRAPRYILTVRPVGFLIPDDAALHASA